MKQFLILGAGTAGTMLVSRLVKKLDNKEWKITIVEKEQNHYYQPGFLFVPFGIYKPGDTFKPNRKYIPKGVEFINSEIDSIDPGSNKVTLVKDKQVIQYDYLVIATGATIRPAETEGLMDGGWRKNIFDFYTPDGSIALGKFLQNWKGGRLVVNIAEMPIKCPVAPLEFIFLADWFFTRKGMRDKVELIYATPLPGAFTKPKASEMLGNLMEKKNIKVEADFAISDVDASNNEIHSYDGRAIGYDLFVTTPVNMGAPVIERSGIGDDLNFVPTDKFTLQSKNWQNVFVLGDASNIPASKAGAVAHFSVGVALENILAHIEGKEMPGKFDGHANCFIETGFNKASLIDFNYDVEPLPGTYPLPVLGPMKLLGESVINHWGKLGFRYMYWEILMRGWGVPLPEKLSMTGKKLD
jgi:sulfide:quinone oxidoreductase